MFFVILFTPRRSLRFGDSPNRVFCVSGGNPRIERFAFRGIPENDAERFAFRGIPENDAERLRFGDSPNEVERFCFAV